MAENNVNLSSDATNINITSMVGSTEQYPALVEAIKSAIGKADKQKEANTEKDKYYRLFQKMHLILNGDADLSEKHLKNTQANFDKAIRQGKDIAASMARLANGIGIVMETVKQMAVPMIAETKKRMSWLSELEKAGVHLAEGFDESFTQLANDAKMSHDQFARMLIANSRQVAKLNAIGLNGARTFSNSLNKSVGKFGYTTDEAATALSSYMENAINFYSKETLAEKLKNDATTKYLKNLKELSAATGKSVDILAQENQLKEDTIFAKKLNAEHPELYGTLKQAGLNDSQIKALVSGRPNEESVLFNATPEGRAIWSQFERVTRGTLAGHLSAEDLRKRVGDILKGPDAERGRKRLENMDYSLASVISGSPELNKIHGNVPGLTYFNDFAAQQVGNNEGDTKKVNNLVDYLAEVDKFKNNWNKALSFSALNASRALGIFGWGLEKVNTIMSTFAGTAIAWSVLFGKTKGGTWAASKILNAFSVANRAKEMGANGNYFRIFARALFGKNPSNLILKPLKIIGKGLGNMAKGIYGAGKVVVTSLYSTGLRLVGVISSISTKLIASFAAATPMVIAGAITAALGAGVLAFEISKLFGASNWTAGWSAGGAALGAGIGTVVAGIPGTIIGGIIGGLAGAGIGKLTDSKGPATTVNYKNEYSYVQEQDVQKSKVQNETLSELKTMNLYMQNTASNTSQLSYSSSESLKEQKFNTLNSNNSAQFAYG